jgi:hypothetical protein
MDVFNPELGEFNESKFGENKFSPENEKRLKQALEQDKENFPDIIQCPKPTCGNPLKIEKRNNHLRVYCARCGWETIVKKNDDESSTYTF